MESPAVHDLALLDRLARVLHEMGLPCACQEEVERTVAVFAEFEDRRSRRRLLAGARERAQRLKAYVTFLDDLDDLDDQDLAMDDIAAVAEAFRGDRGRRRGGGRKPGDAGHHGGAGRGRSTSAVTGQIGQRVRQWPRLFHDNEPGARPA